MKRLLIFLFVVASACGILFIPSILNSDATLEGRDGVNDPKHVRQVKADIQRLSSQKWNKILFDSIATSIQAAYSMEIINGSNRNSLKELLDYEYIPSLVQASKNFVRFQCNDRALMVKLNSELKRYRRQDVDLRQRELVANVKKWMTDIYIIAGYTKAGSSKRHGIDGEILRYTRGNLFDLKKTLMYRDTLESYASNSTINNCEMVKDAVVNNSKRLDTQYYNFVYDQVRNYVDTQEFDKKESMTKRELVLQYSKDNILRNSSETKVKEQTLLKMLDDHFLEYRNK